MAELVGELKSFLANAGLRPWQPGEVDCCMFLASWAMWLGRPDPADHLRGAYDTEEGFREIVLAAGGVVPVVGECVDKIDGIRVATPRAGSIGVIGSKTSISRQWGAIFNGSLWLVRSKTEILPFSANPLAIWDI